MSRSLLTDAFAHHVWASEKLIDACMAACTALTALGVEPPDIDLWVYGEEIGRVIEVAPKA